MNNPRRIGRAFGFLKTCSTASRIKQAFSSMKADPEVMVHKDLDIMVPDSLTLEESSRLLGSRSTDDIGQLFQVSVEMASKGARRVVVAVLPDATNKETASELSHVFNLMYSCTEIMGDAEVPVADIFFKNENGLYVSILSNGN